MVDSCKVEREGHVLIVTINRPEVMNSLRPEDSEAMAKAFDEFENDPDLWVAILTGAGNRAFCTGDDLKFLAEGGELTAPPSGFGGITTRFGLTKPLIAAVNGYAMGGGMEIALACDIIVASDHAVFALPEVHVGLAAMGGGMHRLPRQIGLKNAMGILLTGRNVKAQEAADLGFVNEVVPADKLMDTAHQWAINILKNAPLSVRATKQCAMNGLAYASLDEAMKASYDELDVMLKSDDAKEGPKAFTQKRAPNWSGH
jgi:enoyl-CoA hydratase/carnithine racemase